MKKLKNCPFCGADVNTDIPGLGVHYNKLCDKWIFSHQCLVDKGVVVDLDITIFGMTEQEVIDRWNNRHEDQKSESL